MSLAIRNTRISLQGAVMVAFMFCITGCSVRSPIAVWQDRVTHYISTEGNGDPAVLRDTAAMRARDSARPARMTIGQTDVPGAPFARSRDVQAVFLGTEKVANEHWYVFLVGVTTREADGPVVDDVRMAAFTPMRDALRWRIAPSDPAIVSRYVSARTESDSDFRQTGFPAPLDDFHLSAAGQEITTTESRTGAVWRLSLNPPAEATVQASR